MENKIQIYNTNASLLLYEIVVEDAYIHEKINDKYTFDFTCYEQTGTQFFTQHNLIGADGDYFRIASVNISPIDGKYEVSCEHVGYELNLLTPEEMEEDDEDLHYEGYVWQIIREILQGTRFQWVASDNIPNRFNFVTRSKGKRSRILEFCMANGLEVHWRKFDVAIQKRRGRDNGLVIELGENLRDLKINKIFNIDGTVEQSFDIDFIDLNKINGSNGQPLKEHEFHMGDTVHLKYKNQTHIQRGVAVGYNPFLRALPTIELEYPNRDIVGVIASGGGSYGGSGGSGGGPGFDMHTYLYYEDWGGILYPRFNYEEYNWTGRPFPIEENMQYFNIEIGKLTIQPNAKVKVKIVGAVQLESGMWADDYNWESNPEPLSVTLTTDLYGLPLRVIPHGAEVQIQEHSYNKFEIEFYIENNIRLGDEREETIQMYVTFDTEKGLINVDYEILGREAYRIFQERYPNVDPEDPPPDFNLSEEESGEILQQAFENLYGGGGKFERYFDDYEIVDYSYNIIEPSYYVRKMKEVPLGIQILTNIPYADIYNNISFYFQDEMLLDFIGTGYEFIPDDKYLYDIWGEYLEDGNKLTFDFREFPYIEKK